MDGQRPYIPAPPLTQPPAQTHNYPFPPPPPRLPQQSSHGIVPPPPPGPPPGTAYNVPNSGWQRRPQGFPPPPPPTLSSNQAQNQHLAYMPTQSHDANPLSFPPPPDPPLVSATYIPGGKSFGPGVGIPPFSQDPSQHEIYPYQPEQDDDSRPGVNHPYQGGPSDDFYRNNNNYSQAHPPRMYQLPTHQTSYPQDIGKQPSIIRRKHSSNPSLGGASPNDPSTQWPLDRVLSWLAENNFSSDWQETFKILGIEGADFIELGRGANGRGNLSKMHQVVYPQLRECSKNGTGSDFSKEGKEGTRMRKLIRKIAENGNIDSAGQNHRRQDSNQYLHSASTDEGLESSYNGQRPLSATSHTGPTITASSQRHSQQNESGPESTSFPRSEFTRNVLNTLDETRRRSPSASSDVGFLSNTLHPFDDSPRSGSPATHNASPIQLAPPGTSPSEANSRPDHSKHNSTDSNMARAFSSHLFPGQSGGRSQRHSQESNRNSGGETSATSREHGKGILNMFRKKKNNDSSYPSPEEPNLESPTSPMSARPPPYYSPSNLGDRPPSASYSDYEKRGMPAKFPPARRFIFVTMDGYNYRLVDVSGTDSAKSLRTHLCHNLGIIDPDKADFFLTEPGQSHHDDPLNDTVLLMNRQARADSFGTLKLFVYSSDLSSQTESLLSISQATSTTSPSHNFRNPYPQSPRTSGSTPFTDSNGSLGDGSAQRQSTDAEKEAELLAAYEEHKRETERKQKAYLLSKQQQQQRKDTQNSAGGYGIKREGVINFDVPRGSPFEDKKPDNLVPLRKAPSAPAESSTLTKVNSLSRKPGDNPRSFTSDLKQGSNDLIKEEMAERGGRKQANPSHGLGAALMSVGRVSGAIGKPISSPSDQSFTAPDTGSARQKENPAVDFSLRDSATGVTEPYSDPPSAVDGVPTRNRHRVGRSPVAKSPAGPPPTSLTRQQSQKSGPEFEFKETEVPFAQSPVPEEDSDSDSDDGLFAVPLANSTNGNRGKAAAKETKRRSEKPALTVNTGARHRKGLSVTFKSPSALSAAPSMHSPDTAQSEADRLFDQQMFDPRNSYGTPLSAEDSKASRRTSFAGDDVWASRPPVEGVIDQLDAFFPNIDLDEPYLEGDASASPTSPSAPPSRQQAQPEGPTIRDRAAQGTGTMSSQLTQGTNDTLGSDESTLKARDTMSSVAQRSVGRSGGLGRMKSIREVAKGAHQVSRNRSVTPSTQAKSGDILRRKSTKMFGGKIMQISPKPGSRLSQLDPIQQNAVPQDNLPKRQPTFRIIRGQLIGKGTYGRVYVGMNADTGELLAVKQVEVNQKAANHDKDRIKEMVAALDQEIDTMQHLEHPNIVQYLGCERGDLSISIYLEYIPGGSVGSCLRKHGKFEESVVKSLTRQTLSGLAYLHDQGILHRDLKADNVLLDLDGTCKISDFGISKKTDNIYGNDVTNSMQGSVFWMAPEVVQSQGQGYSAKVDIWSLGCVVLEMFAGRRPWSKEEAIGAIFKLGSLNQAPPIPEDVSQEISPAAIAFMYDCFTIDTFDRPTAETLLHQHPFCTVDPTYSFPETELHAKIRHVL
ncbi:hypothetical protein FQN54_007221 [Arachnomyces sp. PD_36]|nr:hypothetical protein FQN54_007221 [Arachnomyces sp. PD_36]